jgi:hypothetical protein
MDEILTKGIYFVNKNRGSNVPQEKPGSPLKSAAGMTLDGVVAVLRPWIIKPNPIG